jgi:glycerol-3-phosphate dehydrogenase (NAD(P)+)
MDLAKEALHSDICRIYTSTDCVGVDLARLFVDMIQLAMGISDGLSCGHGPRGTIVSRGLIEGARLGERLGAQEHSFLGISGIGELISTLEDTPYYRFGLQTIETGSMPTAGMEVLDILLRLNAANPQSVDLPLTQALKALGQQKLTPSLLIDMLMRRKPTAE